MAHLDTFATGLDDGEKALSGGITELDEKIRAGVEAGVRDSEQDELADMEAYFDGATDEIPVEKNPGVSRRKFLGAVLGAIGAASLPLPFKVLSLVGNAEAGERELTLEELAQKEPLVAKVLEEVQLRLINNLAALRITDPESREYREALALMKTLYRGFIKPLETVLGKTGSNLELDELSELIYLYETYYPEELLNDLNTKGGIVFENFESDKSTIVRAKKANFNDYEMKANFNAFVGAKSLCRILFENAKEDFIDWYDEDLWDETINAITPK